MTEIPKVSQPLFVEASIGIRDILLRELSVINLDNIGRQFYHVGDIWFRVEVFIL